MAENYLKLQSPLQKIDKNIGDINYMYPMTTPNQVVMEDGSRLNVVLSNFASKLAGCWILLQMKMAIQLMNLIFIGMRKCRIWQ